MVTSIKFIRIILVLCSFSLLMIISIPSWTETCEKVTNYVPLVESPSIPKNQNNIFFIESSQPCNKILELNARQVCSIESAARQNPDTNIFLYVVEAKGYLPTQENIMLWKILKSFKNIHLKLINAKNFTLNTPVEELFRRGLNSYSSYLKYHRSDLLRYTLLWKYSGTYLDLDVISQKPISTLGENFAVEQEKDYDTILAGAGAINFNSDAVGREIADFIMHDLARNFDGHKWDDSSVRVLTRAIVKICGTDLMSQINKEKCQGFKVYPPETFYAISFNERELLMYPNHQNIALEMVKNSVGVHAWNKVTATMKIRKTSEAAIIKLAQKYCPLTFESVQEYY